MSSPTRQLAAIMFTDIVGYTALMGKDEKRAMDLIRKSVSLQKPLVKKHHGKWIKEVGDGIIAQFQTALDAVNCAMEIQRISRADFDGDLRIGIHLGDITIEGDDVFGDGVNVASRLQDIADPGGIYISESVEKSIRGHADIQSKFLGEKILKNVDYGVRTYALTGVGLPNPVQVKERFDTSFFNARSLVIIVTIIVLAIIGYFALPVILGTDGINAVINDDDKSIAVLPFVNMSADPEQEYFCDGISEELINLLTKVEGLRVAARTSAFSYKGKNENIRKIADDLGVAMILEGSVRKSGNSLRITAQLIKANDGFHLWSETYNRKLEDVFEIQDEISKSIVDAMKLTWLNQEGPSGSNSPTQSIEAYDYYLLGRHHARVFNSASFKKAIEYYQQAIEIDGEFALAYSEMASTYIFLMDYGDLSRSEAFQLGEEAINKALSIDPVLVEAYASMATMLRYKNQYEDAENICRQGLAISMKSPRLLFELAAVLSRQGRMNEALEYINNAARLDPKSGIIRAWHADITAGNGLYQESEKLLDEWIAEEPDNPFPYESYGSLWELRGQPERAIGYFAKASELRPGDAYMSWKNTLNYILINDKPNAQKWLEEAKSRSIESDWSQLAEYNFILKWGTDGELENYMTQKFRGSPESYRYNPLMAEAFLIAGKVEKAKIHMDLFLKSIGFNEEKGHFPYNLEYLLTCAMIIKYSNSEDLPELLALIRKIHNDRSLYTLQDSVNAFYLKASVAAIEGNREPALDHLKSAADIGLFNSSFLENDPVFKAYRNDPDFLKIATMLEEKAARKRKWLEDNI